MGDIDKVIDHEIYEENEENFGITYYKKTGKIYDLDVCINFEKLPYNI